MLALLPIICLRKMSFIGYFSIFVVTATLIAICLILYESSIILSESPSEVRNNNHIELNDEDRNYLYFDLIMLPVFISSMMGLFEGN